MRKATLTAGERRAEREARERAFQRILNKARDLRKLDRLTYLSIMGKLEAERSGSKLSAFALGSLIEYLKRETKRITG